MLSDKNFPKLVMAGDLPFEELSKKLDKVRDVPEIEAVKIGTLTTGVNYGLRDVANEINDAGKAVIYDMQKMGQDIMSVTKKQASLFGSVADAVIIYPKSVEHWFAAYEALEDSDTMLISVLYMTDGYDNLSNRLGLTVLLAEDANSRGIKIEGVVLPANMTEITSRFISLLEKYNQNPIVFSPGIKAQGGSAYQAAKAGTDVAIVGRALYNADDIQKAALEILNELKRGYSER
ncbi:MAG: orotidine 5'-phosphate decarboxylase [Nanoarchaeota archaeon]|nr:orotidine 5'-phosphate decarboxylase [Nanoarchaeota archaeon]